MPTIDAHNTNTITWIDLSAADLQAAIDFYGEVLGLTSFNDGETAYRIFMRGEEPVAGVMELSPEMAASGMPPVWSTYVSVDSAADTIVACEAAGGSVFQQPFDIPGGGKIAVIADPAGAVICLFEGGLEAGFKVIDEPGAACWFETMSRDADAAKTFYNTLFGWTATDMPGMPYSVFELDGAQIAGLMAMGDNIPPEVPSHWAISFSVNDTDATLEKAVSKGATAVMPPMDTPYGRAAGLIDPWGAGFNIIDRSSALS